MSGLFQRALEYFNQFSGDLPLEDTAGISKEDQSEIRSEIDRIQEESRIRVTPEVMAVKAAKKGVAFPLVVNLFSVLLLAGGGFALWYMFQRGETAAATEAAVVSSAEGKLIEELKRESEAQLLQKNREISDIESRLLDIDRQRQDLQSTMDTRVRAREEELRRGLEAALAAERDKLRGQGVSDADIDRRLQALEAEKSAAFQRELEGFRARAEEERSRAEASLRDLQAEYQRSLAQASADREKVLADARQRETELRAQLAAQTQALEQESAEARQELGRLSEQREKESLATSQLNGLYNRVKSDLQGARYEQALGGLEAIRDYLDDPSVSTLPAIRERREIELFVADSISSLARSQMQAAAADTTSVVAAANLLAELKSRVVEGDELLRAADVGRAEAKYQEALALIPEVSRAHARLSGPTSAESAALQKNLEDKTRELDELKAQLVTAASGSAALRKTVQEKDAEIASLEAERDRLRAEGAAGSAAGTAALQKTIQEKDAEIASLKAERDRLLAGSGEAGAAQRSLQDRASDLERDLAAKVALIQTLEGEKAALQAQVASLRTEIDGLRRAQTASAAEREAELQQKITRLERIQTRYNELVSSYQDYAGKEDALLRGRSEAALLESKLYLNAFLAAGSETFPGLWERIKRYDGAFESAGRASALGDVNDILVELSLRDRAEAQTLFLNSEKVRYRDNPQMVGVLEELLRVVGR